MNWLTGTARDPRAELLQAFRDHAVLHGEFELAHAGKSHFFIEAQRALLTQPCFEIIGNILAEMCDEIQATAIGGPASGAIAPVCAALSKRKGLRGFYIGSLIGPAPWKLSGYVSPKDRVLLVDDVLTTGQSLEWAYDFLVTHEGADPVAAVAIVDRSTSPVELSIPLSSLITAHEIVELRSA